MQTATGIPVLRYTWGPAHADTFISGKDADNINGGDGSDTVSYERSEQGVTVDSVFTSTQSETDSDNPDGSYARGDALTGISRTSSGRAALMNLTAGTWRQRH